MELGRAFIGAWTRLMLGSGVALLAGGCTGDQSGGLQGAGQSMPADWPADQTSASGFQRIADIREIHGGAVLVLDDLEPSVVLLDSLFQVVRNISNVGQGPGEFSRPVQLVGLPSGTTLVIDLVPGRSILIDRYGRPQTVRRLSEVLACPESSEDTWIHSIGVLGADTLGNLYFAEGPTRQYGGRLTTAGRSALARWTPACQRQRLGVLQSIHMDPDSLVRAAADAPFEATSSIAVLPGGGLLIVHASPFSVERFPGHGGDPSTTRLAYKPVSLSDFHKSWWRNEFMRPVPGLVMRSDGLRRGQIFRLSYREPSKWPSVLPPILPNALSIDRSGFAWLRRTGGDLDNPQFDILLPTGGNVDSLTLPLGSRLVGHGMGVVYTARVDRDGFEHLERHRIRWGGDLRRHPDGR